MLELLQVKRCAFIGERNGWKRCATGRSLRRRAGACKERGRATEAMRVACMLRKRCVGECRRTGHASAGNLRRCAGARVLEICGSGLGRVCWKRGGRHKKRAGHIRN